MTEAATRHGLPAGTSRRPSGEPPPLPRQFDRAAIAWLVLFVGWGVVWFWVFLSDDMKIWFTERDLQLMRPIVENRTSWLTPTMQAVNEIGTHWLSPVVGWATLAAALVVRRIRHMLLLIASLTCVAGLVTVIATEIGRPRPLGISQIGDWEGYAQPSRPVALATAALVAAGFTLVPTGAWRRRWHRAVTVAVLLFCFAQVYTGVDHPTDVFAGATVGVAIPLLLYRGIAPETVFPITYRGGKTAHLDVGGQRGDAIRRAMARQLGIDITEIEPVGLAGSSGSTPLRVVDEHGRVVFAKLYASTHLRSDRSYKLGRSLLYGRLEDEQRFTSVRRLIQHEEYMLYLLRAAGVDCQEPLGIVEITPAREYLLVTEFLEGATEISEADVTESIIDQGLEMVQTMWEAGLAHRDIKPSNLMVQDGRLRLIDVAFGQVRPSPWRQAVDLANMMLVLALGSTPELVYERATRLFTEDEVAEAFAASRGVTLPSQLRSEVRRDSRELLDRFRELAPEREPVAIQRWSLRRIGLMAWVTLVVVVIAGIFLSNLTDIGLA